MDQQTVLHNTFQIEREYAASPERVFAAFADPAKKRRWSAEGEHHTLEQYEHDFRVGGREWYLSRFNPNSPLPGMTLSSEIFYREIVPNRRLIFSSAMAINGKTFSVSLGTVELAGSEKGTNLTLTFQSAFLEGSDGPAMREAGWRKLLEKLGDTV